MDDLGAHKTDRVREPIEAAGCELRFPPAYSPGLNPIEEAFSKVKGRSGRRRRAAGALVGRGAARHTVAPCLARSMAHATITTYSQAGLRGRPTISALHPNVFSTSASAQATRW